MEAERHASTRGRDCLPAISSPETRKECGPGVTLSGKPDLVGGNLEETRAGRRRSLVSLVTGLPGGRLVTGRGGPGCGSSGCEGRRGLWAGAHAGLFLPAL